MTAADVILGMARAAVTLGGPTDAPVYDAKVPADPPTRYVVIYPGKSLRSEDLGATADTTDLSWQVTCVGGTRAEVEWLQDRIKAAFVGVKPTITGLSAGVIANLSGQPIRPDTAIPNRVVLYCTDQYGCTATSA